jgi:SAM-dependent methyltransferase
MPDTLLRAVAAEWDDALAELGVRWGRTTVVLAPDADVLAEALLLAGSPPVVASSPAMALLGEIPDGAEVRDDAPGEVVLPGDSVDLLVAVHAWQGVPGIAPVVREAARVLRPGGIGVLAAPDRPRLVASHPRQYAAALTGMAGAAVAPVRPVLHSDLEIELVRAGFREVASTRVDFTRGIFANPAEHAAAVAQGLWRGTADLPQPARDRLGELVLALEVSGPVVDREPWVLVRGVAG